MSLRYARLLAACLGGAAAFWALSAAGAAERQLSEAERPILRFGLLSDAHVADAPGSENKLRAVFLRFRKENVRVVAMTGDLCDTGSLAELRRVRQAWDDVFAGGKNAAGEKVVPLVSWGNHDYHAASFQRKAPITDEVRRSAIKYNKEEAWKIIADEPYPGEIFRKDVDGVAFLVAHWGHYDAELGAYLKEHGKDIPSDRPVFVLQHSHPRNTCFAGWATYASKENLAALMEHPNFFVMSGHSHISVGYDDAIWCGGFVSMAAGCANNACGRRYEYNWPRKDKATGNVVPTRMPKVNVGGTWQGSVVCVYPSKVVVSRYDILDDAPLGEDWVLPFPFPHSADEPLVFAKRARPPEFPKGARISFEVKAGKVYPSRARENGQLHLTFPCALSNGDHSRVVDYRVSVARSGTGEIVAERVVSQEGTALSEPCMAKRFSGWCVFGPDELPHGVPLAFSISPLNAGGRAGAPIRQEYTYE